MKREESSVLADDLASRILSDVGLAKLGSRAGAKPPDSACVQYPRGILADVSKCLGVTAELVDGLGRDGECNLSGSRPSIRLLQSQVSTRTVFTFAHELAHVAVKHYGSEFKDLEMLNGSDLEHFCDRVGGAIALPEGWIRSVIHETPSLHEVYSICQKSQLGPAAVVVRLRELGYECGLLHLRQLADGVFVVVTAVGMPHEVRRLVRPDGRMANMFRSLSNRAIEGHVIELVQRDNSVRMDASCSQSPRGAIVLINCIRVGMSSDNGTRSWRIATTAGGARHSMKVPCLKPWDSEPLLMRFGASA